MAVTVLNSPTTPNVTKTKLVYTISGSNINQPQYQYVTDIYESGSTTLLTRLYTYPNLQGSGIVDIARVLDDNLDYDNFWQVTGSLDPVQAVKTFDIRFGEAYGSSISSSVTIYTGSTSNYIEVFPGIVDANAGTFNFDTGSFYLSSGGNNYLTYSPNFAPVSASSAAKEATAILANSDDYMSVTSLQDLDPGGAPYIRIYGYRIDNGIIDNSSVTTVNLLYTNPTGKFNTLGIGPQNLYDFSSFWRSQVALYDLNCYQSTFDPGAFVVYIKDKWDGVPTKLNQGEFSVITTPTKPCNDEYTRFAFINKLGFWDYYNVYNPTRRVTDVDRKIYDQNYVDYSSIQSIYSSSKRGETQYNTGYTDVYDITTDYIDKPTADWLTELFDSPNVYIQKDGNFIPIVITNISYDWNMSENRTKLFQYTIQYQYANKRYDR